MMLLVSKTNLETDSIFKQIYWNNKSQRSSFGATRQNININFHAVKSTTDPLELTMNVKDLIMLMKKSRYVTDTEDEDILIDIVERFMDESASYRSARQEYLVKRPVLLELIDGESIDLNSTLNGDSENLNPDFTS
jgi:hypothetical protein